MADTTPITDDQLALILQASRDFAFQQLAEQGHFLPFGTQARPDGEVEYVRPLENAVEGTMDEFFELLNRALSERAQEGEILAGATVVNVLAASCGVEVDPAFEAAIRVHVEAPGFSRVVIAPYRIEPADNAGDLPYLVDAKMIAVDVAPVIFTG